MSSTLPKTPKQPDYRWSARQDMDVSVFLYAGGMNLGYGRTRNIGIGGMYVETTVEAQPTGVSFVVNDKHYKLPVTEIWRDANGIGLMINDFNVETVHALRDILYPEH